MKRKKNYLLLELLLAFTIVSLCALPLVRNPLASAQNEISSLERMELERIAELSYVSLKAKLHQQEIPWKLLTKEDKDSEPYEKDTVVLSLEELSGRVYERNSYFWTKKTKEGPNKEDHRLVHLQVTFTPLDKGKKNKPIAFDYDFFLTQQKAASEKQTAAS